MKVRQIRTFTLPLLGLALVLAGCTSGSSSSSSGTPQNGGTATIALPVGYDFAWLGPFANIANCSVYEFSPSAGSWPDLYFAGNPGTTGINYNLSMANPPTYSDGDRKVTVQLKHDYTWSDGTAVTTADVKFFLAIEKAHPLCIYYPGLMPDDIKSVSYQGKYQFTITMNRAYNPTWFTENQLQWITPIPAHDWDKTCATCSVGDNAATPAGAKAVATYLIGQFEKLSTYASNPLWKVVDGPWVIHAFSPVTYQTTFVRNDHYTGPDHPRLSAYTLMSFTSQTAEVSALRDGTVDFGYLDASEIGQVGYFKSHGYTVVGWKGFANDAVEYGFTSPTYGPLVRQVYVRQALQHLVNEPVYIKEALQGYGQADYGNVAVLPGSSLVSSGITHAVYPYSVSAAKQLLATHGWKPGPGGVLVCTSPGSGPTNCGAGIARNRPLSLLFVYQSGVPSTQAEVEAFATAAASAGVKIDLHPESASTEATEGECPPGPCDYGLLAYAGVLWTYGYNEGFPETAEEFGPGNFYGGGYSDPQADRLIDDVIRTPTSSLQPLYNMENYLARDGAGLWFPLTDPITVVKGNLKGWYPLYPNGIYYVAPWYFVK